MTKWLLLAVHAASVLCAQTVPDAADIIRHSIDRDAYNFERFKNYTFL